MVKMISTCLQLAKGMPRLFFSEFLGTALMVGLGCGSVYYGASHEWISFTFAAAVTLAILLFGNISGAHINPAVSIAFWREGRLDNHQLLSYICAQLTGALAAAIVLGGAGPTAVDPEVTLLQAFTIEVACNPSPQYCRCAVKEKACPHSRYNIWTKGTCRVHACACC